MKAFPKIVRIFDITKINFGLSTGLCPACLLPRDFLLDRG